MEITKIPVINFDERGAVYDCNKVKIIERQGGSISADHKHDAHETLFLLKGEAEVTIGTETRRVEAPAKIEIPSDKYHKIVALSEILMLDERE